MGRAEFDALKSGAIVRHKHAGEATMVIADYGDRKLAVRTTEVTNPDEWLLITPVPVEAIAPGKVKIVGEGEIANWAHKRGSLDLFSTLSR